MLNKNDPLIGAVQEVMKRNQIEREAVKLVNEKFGVTDRKALPHEKQGAWDAAYKQVLSEGLHPNQQKLDVHEPEKDKLTAQDFKMLRAKKKPVEEDVTSPSSMGIQKPDYASGTPDYAKSKEQTVNRAAKTSLPAGTMKEAKVNPYAVGMAAVKKSTGDEPPMEKKNITKAHKIAKKIIAKKKMNEGFNNRHDSSVTASAEKQIVAAQLNEDDIDSYENRMTAGLGGFTPYGGGRFGGGGAKMTKLSGTTGRVKASNINTRTGEPMPAARGVKGKPVAIKDAPGLSAAAKARFKSRLDAIQNAAPKNAKNVLKTAKKSPATPAQPAPGERNYDTPIGRLVAKQNAKNAKVKADARPAKDVQPGGARAEFLARAKGVTPPPRPAADVKPGDMRSQTLAKSSPRPAADIKTGGARAEFLARAKANAAKPKPAPGKPVPAADVKPGGARAEFLARAKANALKPPTTTAAAKPTAPTLTKTQQTQRISAIRRVASKKPVQAAAVGATALGVANSVQQGTQPASTNAMSPTVKARQQLAAVGNQTGGVNKITSAAPAAAKPAAPQKTAAAKPAAPQKTAAAKPAAQPVRKAAPQVSSTPAQRAQFNRRIDRGTAAPGTQYKGLGVTSGTKVVQKPMTTNKRLPGK